MTPTATRDLSLYHLLDPEVLADPYPLYRRLQADDPVHWDPYLHAWVVTRYQDVAEVLMRFRATRAITPARMALLGMERLEPVAQVMVRQMLFLDPPDHGRLRRLAAAAFTPTRVEQLRTRVQAVADSLLDGLRGRRRVELMEDFAKPFPAIVTAELLGLPPDDHPRLRRWSASFAEMLGNFQSNADRADRVVQSVTEMVDYFQRAVSRERSAPTVGLVNAMWAAGDDGLLSADEVVANLVVTMVGGLETTTNVIGNGILTLLHHPGALASLRDEPSLVPLAVEELMRFESPVQHTARLAPAGASIGAQAIAEGAAVIAVIGAANRDPARFTDPDTLDLGRTDERHLAFGWGAHFCVGAPLARLESQVAFDTLLRRWSDVALDPSSVRSWRPNLGLRGLDSLPLLVES